MAIIAHLQRGGKPSRLPEKPAFPGVSSSEFRFFGFHNIYISIFPLLRMNYES